MWCARLVGVPGDPERTGQGTEARCLQGERLGRADGSYRRKSRDSIAEYAREDDGESRPEGEADDGEPLGRRGHAGKQLLPEVTKERLGSFIGTPG